MGDLNHFDAPNATHVTNNTVVTSASIDGWEILQKHTAPNALHNSRARYDAPKCDEDTRIEVVSELMGWIKDCGHPQHLLCMTGAAGSGKSALQQSVAECCAKDNILGAAYFISAADPSRNTASTVVPTIAYQLGLNHPTLQRLIAAAVEHDPLIFSRSLETQMNVLVVRPFENLRSEEYDISTFPYAILIDGLDECQDEPSISMELGRVEAKYKAEDRQAELLAATKNSLLNNDLPFRIFIASRPELPVHTALGPTGSLHGLAYHMQLSDQYDATEDMRRYLWRRFLDIGLRIRQPYWFTEGDIETLVQAASGQFVYVATVFKMFQMNARGDFALFSPGILSALLDLESSALEILTLDLRSLVCLKEGWSGNMELIVYHKSLSDFMDQASRAQDLYVPYSRVYTHLAKCCMQWIIKSPEPPSLPDSWEDMSASEQCLITAIAQLIFLKFAVAIDDEIVDFTHNGGWHKLNTVLSKPSGLGLIFSGGTLTRALPWVERLGDAADNLKKCRPEAAAIMSKYLEKWKHFIKVKKREYYASGNRHLRLGR
ncbi:hypothetical protein H1R20_g12950, partial [Candolleomyces eurysporus]